MTLQNFKYCINAKYHHEILPWGTYSQRSSLHILPGVLSPEGLTIDHFRRTMFWTDSGLDKIERARLDGSERRVLFDADLVNPRAITVDAIRG